MKKITSGLLSLAVLSGTGVVGIGVATTVAPSAYAQEVNNPSLNPIGYTMAELREMGWGSFPVISLPQEQEYEYSFSFEKPTEVTTAHDSVLDWDTTKDLPFTFTITNHSDSILNIQTGNKEPTNDALMFNVINGESGESHNLILSDTGEIILDPGETKNIHGVIPSDWIFLSSPNDNLVSIVSKQYDFNEKYGFVFNSNDVDVLIRDERRTQGIVSQFMISSGYIVSPNSPLIFKLGKANPDAKTTAYNTPITFNPLENDTLDTTGGNVTGKPWDQIGFTDLEEYPHAPGNFREYAIMDRTKVIDGKGTFTINDDNTMTFTPEKGYVGEIPTIRYWVSNEDHPVNDGSTIWSDSYNASTIDINVLPENPTASPDKARTPHNTPVSFNITDNDQVSTDATKITDVKFIDADGNPVDTLEVKEGTFTKDETLGTITFTPVDGFSGEVPEIKYQITDDKGRTAESTIKITVGQPPVAKDDSWSIDLSDLDSNNQVRVDVLKNDSPVEDNVTIEKVELLDKNGDAITTSDVYNTNGELVGTVTVDPVTKEFVYTLNGENVGDVVPQPYRITTSEGLIAEAEVIGKITETIDATPITPAPVAADDHGTHTVGESITTIINLLDNDKDFDGKVELLDKDGNVVTTIPVTMNGEEVGTGTLNENNEFVITWNENVKPGEIDPIDYRITNKDGSSSTAKITVTIVDKETTPVDPQPTDPVVTPTDPSTPTPPVKETPVVVVETPISNPVVVEKTPVHVDRKKTEASSDSDSVLVRTGEEVKDNAGALGAGLLGLGTILGTFFGFRRFRNQK